MNKKLLVDGIKGMSEELELKNCPFCGGEAGINQSEYNDFDDHPHYYWSGYCMICQIEGKKFYYSHDDFDETPNDEEEYLLCKSKAIEAWNKRV